jgi:hypothetical protein
VPKTVSIGILAHVDAGRISLTERLLLFVNKVDRRGRPVLLAAVGLSARPLFALPTKATLLDEYGLDVSFEDSRVVCVERLVGVGESVAEMGDDDRPDLRRRHPADPLPHPPPVRGTPPSSPRTDGNPLDSKEYLLHVVRRV